MRHCKDNDYFPIVSVHAGIEHVPTPSIENIKLSRMLSEIAPYLYYGHHPHVLQGAERYKDSLIAHSLGNFIFDDNEYVVLSDENRKSAILEVEIENNSIINYKLTPIKILKGEIQIFADETSNFQDNSEEFDKALLNPTEYTLQRMTIRNKWINDRKSIRNFKWYIRRLKPRYVRLFLSNKSNAKNYLKHVKSKL